MFGARSTKFVNELPESEVRNQLAWLTVLSWKYDGATNNGMPLEAEKSENDRS